MRLAFMGTPDFAVPSLAELIASGLDRRRLFATAAPQGPGPEADAVAGSRLRRGHGPAGLHAREHEGPEAIETFKSLDLDAACVVAYGQILKAEVLDAPRLGCFNLHGSLLPRWRRAAPIQRAIMAGDRQTGAQIMRMSEGLTKAPSSCRN